MDTIRLGSAQFPPLLAAIPDPPKIIWTKGDPTALLPPAVAIVGARAASREGMATAAALAADLSRAGVTVVSGLARGIDAAAHRGALDAGGKTIAVLGTGIDVVYPAEHRELSANI